MSDHKSRNLGTAVIVLSIFLCISIFITVSGPWYHISGSSYLTVKNSYNLYYVHVWTEYGTADASFVKNMDSDISKLFVSMGVFQYLGGIFFLVTFFSMIYSYRETHCTKALKLTKSFSIATFVFLLVSAFELFLITPTYKNSGSCYYSPSPCSSFAGSYYDGESTLSWGPSWAWAFALINVVLSLIIMICTSVRYSHMMHHLPHHHCHESDKAPILTYQPQPQVYYQPQQQQVYYQPQQPIYYQPQQPHH